MLSVRRRELEQLRWRRRVRAVLPGRLLCDCGRRDQHGLDSVPCGHSLRCVECVQHCDVHYVRCGQVWRTSWSRRGEHVHQLSER